MTTRGGRVGRASCYDPGDLIRCQNPSLNLIRKDLSTTVPVVTLSAIHNTQVVGKREEKESERQSPSFHPQCLLLIGPKDPYNNLFINMKTIQSRSVRLNPVQSGTVQVYLVLYILQCIRVGSLQIT